MERNMTATESSRQNTKHLICMLTSIIHEGFFSSVTSLYQSTLVTALDIFRPPFHPIVLCVGKLPTGTVPPACQTLLSTEGCTQRAPLLPQEIQTQLPSAPPLEFGHTHATAPVPRW